jgi:hypothetical protein
MHTNIYSFNNKKSFCEPALSIYHFYQGKLHEKKKQAKIIHELSSIQKKTSILAMRKILQKPFFFFF